MKQVLVLGASSSSTIRYFLAQGAAVRVADERSASLACDLPAADRYFLTQEIR